VSVARHSRLAYAPLFLLWFGLATPARWCGAFVSMFSIAINTWTGVKSVKEIWLRAAQAMARTSGACSAM
jgi:ABC-type nitrate/sulfonate/bicarbonate transport system permease component